MNYMQSSHLHADGRVGGLLVGLGQSGGFQPVGGLRAEFSLEGRGGRNDLGVELALLAALADPALAELDHLLLELRGLWLLLEVAGEDGLGAGAFPVGLEQDALFALHQLPLLLRALLHFLPASAPALELLAALVSLLCPLALALVLLPVHVVQHILLVLGQLVGLMRHFLERLLLLLGFLPEDAIAVQHL